MNQLLLEGYGVTALGILVGLLAVCIPRPRKNEIPGVAEPKPTKRR